MDRRTFLASSTASVVTAAASPLRGAEAGKPLRVALVGCGWFGMVDLRHLLELGPQRVQVIGLCDPDATALEASAKEVTAAQKERPSTTKDFRELLKPGAADVVLVGSPDHWHALHGIAAMQAGADVYLQKPICHTYFEGRALVNTARKLGRVVQVGTQRRSTAHIKQAVDFVREGKLGKVGLVRAYCHVHMRGDDAPPDSEPPATLDWDLWTGPAPMLPYNPTKHPKRWRNYWEYGNGILGDMAIHMMDLARWALGLRFPKRISSWGAVLVEKHGRGNVPDTQTATWDFGDVVATWEHRTWGAPDDAKTPWGITFHGELGKLQLNLDEWTFTPTDKAGKTVHVEAVREADPTKLEGDQVRPAGRAHMNDFLAAVASRKRPVADIEEGFLSTALCQFANIACKVGRTLVWDEAHERFVADEEATRLLRRTYRKPWIYPSVPKVA
jgi:predicted dehydrogenase